MNGLFRAWITVLILLMVAITPFVINGEWIPAALFFLILLAICLIPFGFWVRRRNEVKRFAVANRYRFFNSLPSGLWYNELMMGDDGLGRCSDGIGYNAIYTDAKNMVVFDCFIGYSFAAHQTVFRLRFESAVVPEFHIYPARTVAYGEVMRDREGGEYDQLIFVGDPRFIEWTNPDFCRLLIEHPRLCCCGRMNFMDIFIIGKIIPVTVFHDYLKLLSKISAIGIRCPAQAYP